MGLFLFDLFGFWILWIGCNQISQALMEINNQVDILRFNNRAGFFIVGIGIPLLHLFMVIENFYPDFIKKIEKYKRPVNNCIMGFIAVLIITGFAISSWIQSRAENAGYEYCWYVSGTSALAKTLVYTKDAKMCEDLSAKARAERKSR
jgi:hypothetical protein